MNLPDVIARASCENCIRPITYLAGIGWVHGEIPKYAGEPITCAVPAPAELRCPACYAVCVRNDRTLVAWHTRTGLPADPWCPGSRQQGLPIVAHGSSTGGIQ